MKLSLPIRGLTSLKQTQISDKKPYISQLFGNVWISDRDQVIGGVQIRKGDNVYKKVFGMDGHNGWDIVADKFTPIYAPCDGFIVEASNGSGYGKRVTMLTEENGIQYVQVFGHLDNWNPLPNISYNLKYRGQPVKQGDKIGEVDSTGFSTGHHLHWTLYIYKNYIKQNSNNGYQGAVDQMDYISMTNSLIVKNGNEFGIYDPATSEDGLVTLMRNRGIPVPLTPEGKLDWSKVRVDKQLTNI